MTDEREETGMTNEREETEMTMGERRQKRMTKRGDR